MSWVGWVHNTRSGVESDHQSVGLGADFGCEIGELKVCYDPTCEMLWVSVLD